MEPEEAQHLRRAFRVVAWVDERDLAELDALRRQDPALPTRSSIARQLLRRALREHAEPAR
jgi:hypothetical protein